MPLNQKQKNEIMHLAVLSLDGAASREQLELLSQILKNSCEARKYYLKAIMMGESIQKMNWSLNEFNEMANNEAFAGSDLWQALAENERVADPVAISLSRSAIV